MSEPAYEFELINAAMTTPVETASIDDSRTLDSVQIQLKIDEDDVSTSAFGLIYTLSLLSFRDARAAGYSENQFIDDDSWLAIDMLRNLRFELGGLYFEADYVRGRRMKTTITVKPDGSMTLITAGRGKAAERWISTVQGKKVMSVIKGEKA